VQTGSLLSTFATYGGGEIFALAFSPRGDRLAVASTDFMASTIHVHKVALTRWPARWLKANPARAGVDRQGPVYADGPRGLRPLGGVCRRRQRPCQLQVCAPPAAAVRQLPLQRRVPRASFDHSVKLWDSATGRCITTLPLHESEVGIAARVVHASRLTSASATDHRGACEPGRLQHGNGLVGPHRARVGPPASRQRAFRLLVPLGRGDVLAADARRLQLEPPALLWMRGPPSLCLSGACFARAAHLSGRNQRLLIQRGAVLQLGPLDVATGVKPELVASVLKGAAAVPAFRQGLAAGTSAAKTTLRFSVPLVAALGPEPAAHDKGAGCPRGAHGKRCA
jgi:hypothetical protein